MNHAIVAPIGYSILFPTTVTVAPPTPPALASCEWFFFGLGAGDYVFGQTPLSGMDSGFDTVPLLFDQGNNDGAYYIDNLSSTGFSIVWQNQGSAPSVSVWIMKA